MQKLLFSFFLLGLLLFCFSQNRQQDDVAAQLTAYAAATKLYNQAEKLSLLTGDDEAVQAKADEAYRQLDQTDSEPELG